jgi:hypothetical protein
MAVSLLKTMVCALSKTPPRRFKPPRNEGDGDPVDAVTRFVVNELQISNPARYFSCRTIDSERIRATDR